ncbi:flagellar basal body rod protein FlgC [Algisphaera agarilytica]|uniref:Flagellar basal-body rod protein FlgC n=1 Tax=Algisphaera agarilytica TaxID=1385975 RepID=A0A7X0HAD7_9BACT|nr:flagellar basal body rod protein FlgC [Algisphaera agarilytica]MBB6430734.1 flagellar basal-body rod protein FlgC [Algisphaera agarilytica]
MFGALDTSTSALVANRIRMETVAANVANANSIEDANGENVPFRRRIAILSEGDAATGKAEGVHVRQIMHDPAPFMKKHLPKHPLADKDGYVKFPNINTINEQVNALEIARAYEANIQAAEATKAMMQSALRLLA